MSATLSSSPTGVGTQGVFMRMPPRLLRSYSSSGVLMGSPQPIIRTVTPIAYRQPGIWPQSPRQAIQGDDAGAARSQNPEQEAGDVRMGDAPNMQGASTSDVPSYAASECMSEANRDFGCTVLC